MLFPEEYLKILVALIAITNPIGMLPIFISLVGESEGGSRQTVRLAARLATITVVAVLLTALLTGGAVLRLFGISLDSFRVGGGILILMMSIHMLQARMSPTKHTEEEAGHARGRETVAVVPVGMPLLAGPGAISTVILAATGVPGMSHRVILGVEIVLLGGIVWLVLSQFNIG